jgi:F-type H+-transporting ATPase subunit gamma
MSHTIANLDRKIKVAGDLQSVVRTMKAVAASSIGQYEKSMHSLSEYYRTVELGLSLCFREISSKSTSIIPLISQREFRTNKTGVVVFGSDQGLVGQFNDVVTEQALNTINTLPGKHRVWSVGERVRSQLVDAGLQLEGTFTLPNSVKAITPLVGQILIETQGHDIEIGCDELYLVYNYITSGASYEATSQRLYPLDKTSQSHLVERQWPTGNLPEIVGMEVSTLKALIREYLFVSFFRACTESLASENTSRLAAMQRADKNIAELLENLRGTFHRLRQGNIDEELFDVVSGFEALSGSSLTRTSR